MDDKRFAVSLKLASGYHFAADFGIPGVPALEMDEPPPLGEGRGPNPARLLAAAVGNCLAASLLFCLRKSRIAVEAIDVQVAGTMVRNEHGRFRLGPLRVTVELRVAAADRERMGRCLELFEDFCIVTQSVRDGLDVAVEVTPAESLMAEPQGGHAVTAPAGR